MGHDGTILNILGSFHPSESTSRCPSGYLIMRIFFTIVTSCTVGNSLFRLTSASTWVVESHVQPNSSRFKNRLQTTLGKKGLGGTRIEFGTENKKCLTKRNGNRILFLYFLFQYKFIQKPFTASFIFFYISCWSRDSWDHITD